MISVCMATYNGAPYIRKQLDSILSQLGPDDEIIISDDGSVDGTISIIKSIQDKRIKFYVNKGERGVINNFENALSKASGDYIFLSDQDDVWKSNKIETVVPLLSDNILVVHNAVIIDKDDVSFGRNFFSLRGSKSGYFNNLYRNSYLGCCMCFRRELLKKILPFPKRIEMHDRWIGLMAELYGKVFFSKEELIGYRVHGNNVSNSTGKSVNPFSTMLSIRLWMFFYTITRYIKNIF